MDDDTQDGGPVLVFYVAIEPFGAGFRYLVRQFGHDDPIRIGKMRYDTENEARADGCDAMVGAMAMIASRKR